MTALEMEMVEGGGINWKCIAGTVGSGLLETLKGGSAGSAIPDLSRVSYWGYSWRVICKMNVHPL